MKNSGTKTMIGLMFAIPLSIVLYSAYQEFDILGTVIIGSFILVVVSVILYLRHRKKRSRELKSPNRSHHMSYDK